MKYSLARISAASTTRFVNLGMVVPLNCLLPDLAAGAGGSTMEARGRIPERESAKLNVRVALPEVN